MFILFYLLIEILIIYRDRKIRWIKLYVFMSKIYLYEYEWVSGNFVYLFVYKIIYDNILKVFFRIGIYYIKKILYVLF